MGAILLALVAGACNATGPTPAPSASEEPTPRPTATASGAPTPDASGGSTDYDAIEAAVRSLRGLEELREVPLEVFDEDGLRAYVTDGFHEDNPADYIAASDLFYQRTGLFDPDEHLETLYLELLSSQVAGLYDPEAEEMYVVSRSGAIGPNEQITYAHEYNHALQDQAFDLEALGLDELDQGDRNIARIALVEGDATLVMFQWAFANLSQAELQEVIAGSADPEALALLERMPPILRAGLEFPYSTGLVFAQGLFGVGGWDEVNAAFDRLPASTEQIIHPEKYVSGEAPVPVDIPDDLAANLGAGWTVGLEDTFGEFQFSVWLDDVGGLQLSDANAAAAGWGGDRLVSLDGPDGAWAVVFETTWDSADEADAFREAATGAVDNLRGDGRVGDVLTREPSAATVLLASDAATLGRVANLLGLAG